jgi:HSP20 family protein
MTIMERTFPVLESLWAERWRRLFDVDVALGGLLRIEEFTDVDTLVLRAELPGIDPAKDVELTVAHGMLHIHATRSETSDRTSNSGYRSEFRYGTFERDVLLPDGVTCEDVTANYTDGILEIRVPMPKTATVTKVAISHKT